MSLDQMPAPTSVGAKVLQFSWHAILIPDASYIDMALMSLDAPIKSNPPSLFTYKSHSGAELICISYSESRIALRKLQYFRTYGSTIFSHPYGQLRNPYATLRL